MFDSILALFIGAALLLGSPGPATISLALVAGTFGVRKGLNYLAGILCGLAIVVFVTSLGLAQLLETFPKVKIVLLVFSFFYLLYIAYKIGFSGTAGSQSAVTPPGFKDGFILNITNPKAYAVFFSIFSAFQLPHESQFWSFFLTGLIAYLAGFIVDLIWTLLGGSLAVVLNDPKRNVFFRKSCAVLLVTVIVWQFAYLPLMVG